jgi:multidrug efflux system membrane fusion protein
MDENTTPPPESHPASPAGTSGGSAEAHSENPQLPAGTPQKQIAGPGAPAASSPPPRRRSSKSGWLWFVLLLIVAVVTYFLWPKVFGPSGSGTATSKSGKGAKGGGAAATNVVATRARRGNIGVYFTGLGSVTPIYTVTLKSRVDGQLMTVNYTEGEIVHKDDLLAQIDPRPYEAALTQAQGVLLRDQALLDNARIDLVRYQTLIKTKAVPEQTLATQEALVKQDEGIVKTDEGSVASAQVNLVYTKITAPFTGRTGLRLVDPGNIVQTSDSNGLVVITQIDPISVIFTISEDQIPAVVQKTRAGQKLPVDAFDREMKNKIASGTLSTIDNEIDQSTGTVRVRALFDNKAAALFPNQFVNARLLVETHTGVVLLSSAAIQRTSSSQFVYLVQPDSTVTLRNVTLGVTEGDDTEITSGLNAGDVVVMSGADKLEEGAKVNPQIPGEQASQAAPSNTSAPTPAKSQGKQGAAPKTGSKETGSKQTGSKTGSKSTGAKQP